MAAFRKGALGDAGTMNDREATDALIELETGASSDELGAAVGDGYFIRDGSGGAQVANRQFSLTVDGQGQFIAVRAFVALNYSVLITVTCEGADVNTIAGEVLGKSAIFIDTDAQP